MFCLSVSVWVTDRWFKGSVAVRGNTNEPDSKCCETVVLFGSLTDGDATQAIVPDAKS